MENKWSIFNRALKDSFVKLNPKVQIENPVMMIVYLGAIVTTVLFFVKEPGANATNQVWFTFSIAIILWLTLLFANFSEAIAEGRGKAQADSLKQAREDVTAKRIKSMTQKDTFENVLSSELKKGDLIYVLAGEQIPMDGEVVEGGLC